MEGDPAPPPPWPYKSLSERHKAVRESARRTRRERKSLEDVVRLQHGWPEAVGAPIKPHGSDVPKTHHQISALSAIYDLREASDVLQVEQIASAETAMAGQGSKEGIASGATPRRPAVQRSEVHQQ
jgi:hypothetical protein